MLIPKGCNSLTWIVLNVTYKVHGSHKKRDLEDVWYAYYLSTYIIFSSLLINILFFCAEKEKIRRIGFVMMMCSATNATCNLHQSHIISLFVTFSCLVCWILWQKKNLGKRAHISSQRKGILSRLLFSDIFPWCLFLNLNNFCSQWGSHWLN